MIKFLKFFRWVLSNFLFLVLVYLGHFKGIVGCERVAVFLVMFGFFLILVIIADEKMLQRTKQKGLGVPAKVAFIYDVFVTCGLVYIGWWATAIVYLLTGFLQLGIFIRDDKKTDKEESKNGDKNNA